jgi:hypothetical protein
MRIDFVTNDDLAEGDEEDDNKEKEVVDCACDSRKDGDPDD